MRLIGETATSIEMSKVWSFPQVKTASFEAKDSFPHFPKLIYGL
jgi:hypothetical protein